MECYFGKEVQDLAVPKGYEQAKMISSSPESGSQWGDSYPKKNFDSNMNMTHEEHNGGSILWNDETVFQQFADEENAMEWYFDNKVEDLVVPKGCDQSQMNSSSTESWSQWGMTPKKNFDSEMNMSHEELYNNGGSLLWNDEADFQQFAEEEARINHMEDDIFFSSLLEQDSTKDSTETHDNTTLGNNADIIKGKMANSQYVGHHGQSFGSSRYLKTHAFSPSTDWANGEVSTTCQMQKHDTTNENSMEESVLNDLERVTAQFTDKTRICFRDAFYRLAESSKQSLNSCQDGESMMASNDDTLRAGETEDSESETNVIDRAVASFIFHKFEFDGACSQQQTDYNEDAEGPISIRGMQELQQATAF